MFENPDRGQHKQLFYFFLVMMHYTKADGKRKKKRKNHTRLSYGLAEEVIEGFKGSIIKKMDILLIP